MLHVDNLQDIRILAPLFDAAIREGQLADSSGLLHWQELLKKWHEQR